MICGFLAIPVIIRFCNKHKLFDLPDVRKVHKTSVPRLGGICFMPSMSVALLAAIMFINFSSAEHEIQFSPWSVYFFFSLFIIYMLGLIDDIIGLDAKVKFVVQIVAASFLPFLGGLYFNNLYGFMGFHEISFYIGAPLTVFVIVFVCNAINLIDGIDGLSAGLSLISLTGFLVCYVQEGLMIYSMLIASLMGVIVAFLYYNLFGNLEKKTKIFMGDSGSLTLGFILGFLLVKFSMDNPNVLPFRKNSMLLAYTMLIVPTFDVFRVILVRFFHRCSIFGADKNHLHHKLMRAGLTQRQTLIAILFMAIGFIIINILLSHYIIVTYIVIIDIIIWFMCQLYIDYKIRKAGNKSFMKEIKNAPKHICL